MDPRVGSDLASVRLFSLVHRSLFKIGPDLDALPDLVESWEREGTTLYRLKMRDGVRFSDGRRVTASDAAFTLESILSGAVDSYLKGDLDRIKSVRAVSDSSLEIELSGPFSPFLTCLTVGIVPTGTPSDQGVSPPGCGPYRMVSSVPGQWVFLEKNPYSDLPATSPTVAFKIVPDSVVRALEIRRGSADLVINDLPPDSLAYFKKNGYSVTCLPGSNFRYIGLNAGKKPLSSVEVRRALALSLDRVSILENIQDGFGRLADSLISPENWAYSPALHPLAYDPGLAEKLLDGAGYKRGPDGTRLGLTYKTSTDKVARQIAMAAQADWAKIGVKVQIRSLEWATFYSDIKRGDFDLFGLTWVGVSDPDGFRLRFSSAAVPPNGLNRGRYCNPALDVLLEVGAFEQERLRRKEIYSSVQEILRDEMPYIPLWHPDNVAVCKRDIVLPAIQSDGSFSFLARVSHR